MKWFQHDSDARQDPKLRLLVNGGGMAAYGAYWALTEYVAQAGEGDPGWAVKADGTALDPFDMAVECGQADEDALAVFLDRLAALRLVDRDAWRGRRVVFLPAMAKRADEYSKKKAAGVIDRRPFGESGMTRRQIFERDGFVCWICRREFAMASLEVDHVIAKSRGGTDDPSNLRTCCRSCNRRKGTNEAVIATDKPAQVEVCPESPVDVTVPVVVDPDPFDLQKQEVIPIEKDPVEALVHLWNTKASKGLPKILKLTDERRRFFRAALARQPSLADWERGIVFLNDSDWWIGRGPKGNGHDNWTGDLEYLAKPGKLQAALEKADAAKARAGNGGTGTGPGQADEARRRGRVAPSPGKYSEPSED